MIRNLVCLVVLLSTGTLFGCGTAPTAQNGPTPTGSSQAATASRGESTPTQWVPSTALSGTPIPGAEATLTAAPQLRNERLVITTSTGKEVAIEVEIADTDAGRSLGLMFRTELPTGSGMLFDFGSDTTSGFWMQNTLLPLSIAFISADGTIVDIDDMQPLDTTTVGSSVPYRYALEVNQGYFRVHGIKIGDRITLPASPVAALPGMPGCDQ